MGGTEEEVKQKHKDGEGKEGEKGGEEKVKDKKKKKDKEKGGEGENGDHGEEKGEGSKEKKEKKEKKKKNPEDKKDPTKLKLKLEKLDGKMRDLAIKREEVVKLIQEAEKNGTSPKKGDHPTVKQD